MINIRISRNDAGDYDLKWQDGKIVMAEDGAAAAVAVTERFLLERTECEESPVFDTAADPLAGVEWYAIIWKTDKSKAEKELELQRAILSAPGVERILSWSWTQTVRTVTIDMIIKTAWGAVSSSQEIVPL